MDSKQKFWLLIGPVVFSFAMARKLEAVVVCCGENIIIHI